jgi:hypothetical protein
MSLKQNISGTHQPSILNNPKELPLLHLPALKKRT